MPVEATRQTPRDEQLPPIRFSERRLLNNFYGSFPLSQQDRKLQAAINEYTIRQIGDEVLSISNKQRLSPYVEAMQLPQPEGFEERFEDTWNILGKVKKYHQQHPFSMYEDTAERNRRENQIHRSLLHKIGIGMTSQDLYYQEHERPGKNDGEETHESFFRTYALERGRAQTEDLTKLNWWLHRMYLNVGIFDPHNTYENQPEPPQEILDRGIHRGFGEQEVVELYQPFAKLRAAWEQNHPGKKFMTKSAYNSNY